MTNDEGEEIQLQDMTPGPSSGSLGVPSSPFVESGDESEEEDDETIRIKRRLFDGAQSEDDDTDIEDESGGVDDGMSGARKVEAAHSVW